MSLKQGLNEDEYKKLVEILSRRKEEHEGITTIDAVRESLIELGLSDLLVESDIEEVRKKVNREFKRKQRKNYFIFGLILIILITPLAAYGGYKFKEFIIAKFPEFSAYSGVASSPKLVELEKQIKELGADKLELEERLKDSQDEKYKLEKKVEALEEKNETVKTSSPTPKPTTTLLSESTQTTTNSLEAQGLIFELRECQQSSTSPTTQNITCFLLITSTKENAKVYLYSNYNPSRKSRIIEAGKENIATKVKLGSNLGDYRADNNLIKDIPMEGIITFENVLKETEKIGVIQIGLYLESSYYSNDIQIEFRNINLSSP